MRCTQSTASEKQRTAFSGVSDIGRGSSYSESSIPHDALLHVMHITSAFDRVVVDNMFIRMRDMGVIIDSWRSRRTGDLLTQTICIRGASLDCIHAMREELVAVDQVLRVRLEHLWQRAV